MNLYLRSNRGINEHHIVSKLEREIRGGCTSSSEIRQRPEPIHQMNAETHITFGCSDFFINSRKLHGGGYSIVGEPLTVEDEYVAVWKRARLDTDELARLRFGEGWTVNRLVDHFGYSRTAIKRELKGFRVKRLSAESLA